MITIPTLSQLYTQVLADFQSVYGSNIPSFGKNMMRALAAVQAAKLKLFYLAVASLQKNIFVDTADPEAAGGTLERFGRIKLNRNPFAATQAQYTIQVTGTLGATIPALQTFKSNDDSLNPGMLYILDVAHVLVATTDYINVRALTGGLVSKLLVTDGLTATAPIPQVNSSAVVTAEFIAPQDAEAIEDYRSKCIQAYRLEPQGGAAADYRLWSFDAQGVQQTYPYARTGSPNEINLYVEATTAASTDGHGTPNAALLTAVEAVVEMDPDTTKPILERGRRPLGVQQVHYLAVIPKAVDIIISTYVGATPDIQTAIFNALKEYVNSIRPFVGAIDPLSSKNDIMSTNGIITAILNAVPGSSFGAITLKVATVPYSSYTFQFGNIPYLNSVTYS